MPAPRIGWIGGVGGQQTPQESVGSAVDLAVIDDQLEMKIGRLLDGRNGKGDESLVGHLPV